MDKIDIILIMSVNPGFGGQSFIPAALHKIREARQRIQQYQITHPDKHIMLEVDGGVKVDNIRAIATAGANTFVAGSAIFNEPSYEQIISKMRAELAKIE
jgi:ribulose-phosphate 3-epimerase